VKPHQFTHSDEVPHDLRNLYGMALGLSLFVQRGEARFVAECANRFADPKNAESAIADAFRIAQADTHQQTATAKVLLASLLASDEYKRAESVMAPLLRREAEQAAKDEADRRNLMEEAATAAAQLAEEQRRALEEAEHNSKISGLRKTLANAQSTLRERGWLN